MGTHLEFLNGPATVNSCRGKITRENGSFVPLGATVDTLKLTNGTRCQVRLASGEIVSIVDTPQDRGRKAYINVRKQSAVPYQQGKFYDVTTRSQTNGQPGRVIKIGEEPVIRAIYAYDGSSPSES